MSFRKNRAGILASKITIPAMHRITIREVAGEEMARQMIMVRIARTIFSNG